MIDAEQGTTVQKPDSSGLSSENGIQFSDEDKQKMIDTIELSEHRKLSDEEKQKMIDIIELSGQNPINVEGKSFHEFDQLFWAADSDPIKQRLVS